MNDTIIARASAAGPGAIAVVRMSGPEAVPIADRMVVLRSGLSLREASARRLHRGAVEGRGGVPIDDGLVVVFRGPRSYTGEDVVELHVHGGEVVARSTVARGVELGARPAAPGEFTKRAFLSGRLDLAQAEAVAALIEASSEAAAVAARRVLGGEVGQRMDRVRRAVIEVQKWMEAAIDFPEEAGELEEESLDGQLADAEVGVRELLRGCEGGDLLREGRRVVLCGPPNVGKSSLFNRLLGADRALVTDIPGTTRDLLLGEMRLGGARLLLQDSAGIRDSDDAVERLGIARARAAIQDADLVVLVLDASQRLPNGIGAELDLVRNGAGIVVLNKSDLEICLETIQAARDSGAEVVEASARTGRGIDALVAAVTRLTEHPAGGETPLLVATWQLELMRSALEDILGARSALRAGRPPEMVAFHLYEVLGRMDDVLGSRSRTDVLDRIFSSFCLGK